MIYHRAMKTIFEIDLVRLAKWHRICSFTVLIVLLTWIVFITVTMSGRGFVGLEALITIFYVATVLFSCITIGMTQRAMGKSVLVCILWGLSAFLLSFLILLSTASSAGMILKLAGAKVGTLGVSKDNLDLLRPHHCRGCGYSREGIGMLDPCPECTRVPQVI